MKKRSLIVAVVIGLMFGAAAAWACPDGQTRTCVSWDQRCDTCTVCDERNDDGDCLRSHQEKCNCGTVCLEWACQ